jgi:RHS repeat-associated protein
MGVADSTDTTQVGYYTANVVTANDYYPFGMEMPGRTFSLDSGAKFRYGFNGKEKDNSIEDVNGADYEYGARIYDARIGRWLSMDPWFKKYPDLNPYVFSVDNPIRIADPDGKGIIDGKIKNTPYEAALNTVLSLQSESVKKIFAPFLGTSYNIIYDPFTGSDDDGAQTDPHYGPGGPNTSAITHLNLAPALGYTEVNQGFSYEYKNKPIANFLTILHEGVHAYIINQIKLGNLPPDARDTRLDGDENHNLMADNYRNVIVDGLTEYNKTLPEKDRLSTEQIDAVSWVGLDETDAFKKVYTTDAQVEAWKEETSAILQTKTNPTTGKSPTDSTTTSTGNTKTGNITSSGNGTSNNSQTNQGANNANQQSSSSQGNSN